MPSERSQSPEVPEDDIEPYEILGVSHTASAADIKTAYRKKALKAHPDKVPPEQREAAHKAFQTLAHAYAILSSPSLRARYDATGSTSLSNAPEGNFNWTDFFRAQYAETVTPTAISDFSNKYKGSAEEEKVVLASYTRGKGKWSEIYRNVMLSNPIEDEDRYRAIIDKAIKTGKVKAYDSYTNETIKAKEQRMKDARREGKEAEDHAKKIGVWDKLHPGASGSGQNGAGGMQDLGAMIQQRNKERSSNFLDALEAKYAGKGKKRKDAPDEPSEEAFAKTAARAKKAKTDESIEMEEDAPAPAAKKRGRPKKVEMNDDDEDTPRVKQSSSKSKSKSKAAAKPAPTTPQKKKVVYVSASEEDDDTASYSASDHHDDNDPTWGSKGTPKKRDPYEDDSDGTYGKKKSPNKKKTPIKATSGATGKPRGRPRKTVD